MKSFERTKTFNMRILIGCMKYPWVFAGCVVAMLSGVALWRGEFSVELISAPLKQESVCGDLEIVSVLQQPFSFLGKGRQTFAFESQDHRFVIKFFNRKYLQMPWYSFVLMDVERERHKRGIRQSFYQNSYALAWQNLQEETCIVYVHDHVTAGLPVISVRDQTGKFRRSISMKSLLFCKKGRIALLPFVECFVRRGGKAA